MRELTDGGETPADWIIDTHMKMKKTMLLTAAMLLPFLRAGAQYMTYNHDETKMNQVTVMETGAGSLTPTAFYSIVHNQYYKTAGSSNKLLYRTEAAVHSGAQVSLAKQIDTSLTKRAEIEMLNMADCQVDLAWQAEGQKIRARMESFRKNIDRIIEAGGTSVDMGPWMERYRLFETAVSAIRESYMPNAERKKQYQAIFQDIVAKNDVLISYIIAIEEREKTKSSLGSTLMLPRRNGEIAGEASLRWKNISKQSTD